MCDQQSLRSACAYAQYDQCLCSSLEYSMSVKLMTEHHLEFLSSKASCTGSSYSTLIKTSHCWKLHAMAHKVVRTIHTVIKKLLIRIPCIKLHDIIPLKQAQIYKCIELTHLINGFVLPWLTKEQLGLCTSQ